MTRRIATALVSGVMSLTALGLGAGIAQAMPDSGTWCPGDPVPGGFTQVNCDWDVCHQYQVEVRGPDRAIVGLKVEDGAIGGSWRLVAGEDTNVTCRIFWCPRP